jgi:glycosyltransferase involved in cell wall biosynthesis
VSVFHTGADDTPGVSVSVVIVTRGRPRHLSASLASYAHLAPDTPPFEVIVVLDGENAESTAVASLPYPFPTRVLSQPTAGIGAAKNLGVTAAKGDLVLFLNDDTRPDPSCVRVHADAQRRFGPSIVVGRVEWDPDHEVTPYMAWLAPAGHQFNFARLRPDAPIPWDACWGAHLAAPRAWLLDDPFDPSLPYSVLEDGE